jgi:UDP-N-acetylmuramoylalanine--D-glutamate ligase
MVNNNIFIKKTILIYGLGKSGISSYFFLKKNNNIFLYDDYIRSIKNEKINKSFIKKKNINKIEFDFIVISPGININNCILKKYLKKNLVKIITDLDIFYSHYSKNKNITITGTNGKSTTAKILFDVLNSVKKDVRLTGNIGNPVLYEKNITPKTIFVIEASSYQIEYSKNFKANYAAILNITPDHIERHKTFKAYTKAKFKLVRNQVKNDYSFLNMQNKIIKKEIQKNRLKSKIIKVSIKDIHKDLLKIKNLYFKTEGNKENLSFIFSIIKKLGIKKKILIKVLNNFKGLKFRQEIIFKSKKITLINDSKATSFSSSINVLKSLNRVFWLLGGIPKKGDKFSMQKNECLNFKAYIFGKNKNFFINQLKNKIIYEKFNDLSQAFHKLIIDLRLSKNIYGHITILFSPSAASFDNYKNFEDRGKKFNELVEKLDFKKLINDQ